VADSGVTHHTTPSVGNVSTPRPFNSSNPSSIIVGNGSSLLITSVGDSVLPEPFYLNNILLAPDMVQSLLSIHCFTTDNWCSMEFDSFRLSVKDLSTRNVIVRSNSIGPLYTLRLPGSTTPSAGTMAAFVATPHALAAIASTMWHRHLGHLAPDVLSSLSRSFFIHCTSSKHDFCHTCQLDKHTRLPFHSSSHRAEHPFDLIHLGLCDRTTSKMRGLSPRIISGDSRRSENAQTYTNKHTIPNIKFKLNLLQIKCHVLGFTKDKAQNVLQKIIRVFALEESGPPRMTYACESQ
jgi:hypothetical protein